MIKLLAIDIDGTLLDSSNKLRDNTVQALKELNSIGVVTVLASGRALSSVRYYTKLMGFDNPCIGNNGAVISLSENNIYKRKTIDEDLLIDLYEYTLEEKLNFHFYDNDTFYSNTLDINRINHLKIDTDYGMNYQVRLEINEDPVRKFLEEGKKANKFQIVGNIDNPISEGAIFNQYLNRYEDKLYITRSNKNVIEIMNKQVNKYLAIKDLLDLMGIDKEEFAAIGDSYNDIEMVTSAKLGFAMGNANESLKDVCNHIVADNDSDGILDCVSIIKDYNKC